MERYGENILTDSRFDELWPKLKAKRNAELLPYIRARWAVMAAGAVSGLGLLGWTLRDWFRQKKGAPLLRTHRNDDKISPIEGEIFHVSLYLF